MASPTTSDEFLDVVRRSELVPPARLEAFAPLARPARELAGLLVDEGLLTNFQAEQLLQGKYKGFSIGKYRVLERVGAGGMGTVYLCRHATLGGLAAVKVLPASQSANPAARGRFYREARASAALDHPNLVKAHDVGEENGVHFIVMDYVDGSSLQSIVARFGPLPWRRAAHYVRQAADGLHAAHEAGLIHRDVKPANVLLGRTGTVRLLDLGLARFYEDHADPLTMKYDEANILGTADYVSPEQALDSHNVDPRTDVYSLGATFYFLLTGRPPFPTGRVSQKLVWLQVREPTPLRELRPDVPEGLAAVVEKMMAKDPEARFAGAAEVAGALQPWTAEPVDPPREEEMPRLCPAARAAGTRTSSTRRPRVDSGTSPDLAVHTPTTPDQPRPVVVPSRLLPPAPVTAPGWGGILRAGLFVLTGCAAGAAATWLARAW